MMAVRSTTACQAFFSISTRESISREVSLLCPTPVSAAAGSGSAAEQRCCVSRGLRLLGPEPFLRWPGGGRFHQGVQDRQPLAHAGREGPLAGFPTARTRA